MRRELAEIVVVDARYTFEELDFSFAAKAEQIVVVAKPTVPSLHSMKMLLEQLAKQEVLGELYVVINQFISGADEFSVQRIADTLGLTRVLTISDDVTSIRNAENLGKTLRAAAPRGAALADITELARAMLGMPAEPSWDGRYWSP